MQRPETACAAQAITELYERYARTILATIRHYVSHDEDAEDALLEVFLAALENTGFLELDENVQIAWLRRVAYYKAIDCQRRTYRRRHITSLEQGQYADLLPEDMQIGPEQALLRREEHQQLRARVEQLPENQQEVIRLHFGAGMRCVDIATHLKQREGTVRTWLARSLKTLRTFYEQRQEGNA